MSQTEPEIPPPGLLLAMLEARSVLEIGASLVAKPLYSLFPSGDGHPVMVLPGFGAGDLATSALRGFLRDRGYSVHGWGNGIALASTRRLRDTLHQRIASIQRRHVQHRVAIGCRGVMQMSTPAEQERNGLGAVRLGSTV